VENNIFSCKTRTNLQVHYKTTGTPNAEWIQSNVIWNQISEGTYVLQESSHSDF